MSSPRSRFQIYIEILGAIDEGSVRPTSIMNRIRFGWEPLKRTLHDMSEEKLVEWSLENGEGIRRKYMLTERGRALLMAFRNSDDLLALLTDSGDG